MNCSSLTDIGAQREMNQDYFFVSDEPIGRLPNLFLVADGMGGHKAGEFASRFAVETLVETVRTTEYQDPVAILADAIRKANKALKAYADEHPEMSGMGTTMVAATISEHNMVVANVGDSRLYLIDEETHQITRDHSLVEEMVRMGEMAPERAKHHPDKNIITRAVGVEADVEPDLFETVIEPGQRVLMCSDGLTNMVEESEIVRVLNGEGSLDEKAERLIELANQNGGKDNITVLMIEPDTERGMCRC